MDYRCNDNRCSFEIEHRANSAKVADTHEARARKLSDVIRETKVLVKNYTWVADRRGWSECVGRSRVKVEGNGRVLMDLLLRPKKSDTTRGHMRLHV